MGLFDDTDDLFGDNDDLFGDDGSSFDDGFGDNSSNSSDDLFMDSGTTLDNNGVVDNTQPVPHQSFQLPDGMDVKKVALILIIVAVVIFIIIFAVAGRAGKKKQQQQQMPTQQVVQENKNVNNVMGGGNNGMGGSSGQSNNVSINKMNWKEFLVDDNAIVFENEYREHTFTITSISHYVSKSDSVGDIQLKTTLTGALSGLSGTYEIEVPYFKGRQLHVGNSFNVQAQWGSYNGNIVIGDITY